MVILYKMKYLMMILLIYMINKLMKFVIHKLIIIQILIINVV